MTTTPTNSPTSKALPAHLRHQRSSSSPSLSSKRKPPLSPLSSSSSSLQKSMSFSTNDFEFSKLLGEGAYSRVMLSTFRENGMKYATKVIQKQLLLKENKIKTVKTEKEVLNRMDHPNIIKLFCTYQDKENLYFALELAPGGELFSFINKHGPLSLEATIFYTAEIVNALEYMHGLGIIHRDLKPENIILSKDMHVKITDFGTAKIMDEEDSSDADDNAGLMKRKHKQTFCVVGSTQVSLGNGLARTIENLTNTAIASHSQTVQPGLIAADQVAPVSASFKSTLGSGIMGWGLNGRNLKSKNALEEHDIRMDGRVSQFILRGERRSCIRITLEDGRTLDLTPDHQVLAIGPDVQIDQAYLMHDYSTYELNDLGTVKWIPAGKLQPRQHRVICSTVHAVLDKPEDDRIPEFGSFKLSFPFKKDEITVQWNIADDFQRDRILAFSRLCGMIGTMQVDPADNASVIFGHEIDAQQFIADVRLVLEENEKEWQLTVDQCFDHDHNMFHIPLPAPLIGMLKHHDVETTRANNFHLPKFLTHEDCPPGVVREFLAAFWGVAGTVPSFVRINGSTTTLDISCQANLEICDTNIYRGNLHSTAKQLADMFNRLGVEVDIIEEISGTVSTCNTTPRIIIRNGQERTFAERVGVRYCIAKQRSFGAMLSYLGWKDRAAHKDTQHMVQLDDFLRDTGYGHAIDNCRQSVALRVASIEIATSQYYSDNLHRVYDASSDLHSFVANGVVVHNCGTAEYVSPEILLNKPCNEGADLWALGCIIYQCLTGRHPFKAKTEYLIFQQILKRELEFPEGIPEVARDLIDRLLQLDPEKRLGTPTMGGYRLLKEHPFFNGIDFDNIHNMTPPPLLPLMQEDDDDTGLNITMSELSMSSDSTPSSPLPISRTNSLAHLTDENWKQFLNKQESILFSRTVVKRRRLSAKKRQLILTDRPRLLYIDPYRMIVKGLIPWSKDLKVIKRSSKDFMIRVPGRTYILEDLDGDADAWVKVIEAARDSK